MNFNRSIHFIFSIALCMSCSTGNGRKTHKLETTKTFGELDVPSMWVQNGCTLIKNKEWKPFPGVFCIFLDDGRLISATGKEIRMYSPTKEILWEKKGHFHHQLNLTIDKKRILALSSEVVTRNKKKERDDVFLIMDLEGNEIARESFYPHFKEKGLFPLGWDNILNLVEVGADVETSHFNSIYEIPKNIHSKELPWLQEGNIIVNSHNLGIFVFSPDLKRILHRKVISNSAWHSIHDVQITPESEYLFLNNRVTSESGKRFSAIQKFSEWENRTTFDFRASPPEMFFSANCGGVQELGDIIFFSHVVSGGYFYSKSRAMVFSSLPLNNLPTQQLKLIDATNFLKNSSH